MGRQKRPVKLQRNLLLPMEKLVMVLATEGDLSLQSRLSLLPPITIGQQKVPGPQDLLFPDQEIQIAELSKRKVPIDGRRKDRPFKGKGADPLGLKAVKDPDQLRRQREVVPGVPMEILTQTAQPRLRDRLWTDCFQTPVQKRRDGVAPGHLQQTFPIKILPSQNPNPLGFSGIQLSPSAQEKEPFLESHRSALAPQGIRMGL